MSKPAGSLFSRHLQMEENITKNQKQIMRNSDLSMQNAYSGYNFYTKSSQEILDTNSLKIASICAWIIRLTNENNAKHLAQI